MSKSFKANRQDDGSSNSRKGRNRQRRDKELFTSRNVEPSSFDIYIASEMHGDAPFDDNFSEE